MTDRLGAALPINFKLLLRFAAGGSCCGHRFGGRECSRLERRFGKAVIGSETCNRGS